MKASDFFFLVLVALCATMSAVTSGAALKSAFASQGSIGLIMAVSIALAMFVAIFLINMAIVRRRRAGGTVLWPNRRLIGPLFALVAAAAISSTTTFAFVYSATLREKLVELRVDEAAAIFKDNVAKARTALIKVDRLEAARLAVDGKTQDLRREVRKPPRGFGPDARAILEEIDATMKTLGAPGVARLTIPPRRAGETANEAALSQVAETVTAQLDRLARADPVKRALLSVDAIASRVAGDLTRIASARPSTFADRSALLDRLSRENAALERLTREGMARAGAGDAAPELPDIRSDDLELRTFDEVYRSAALRRDDDAIAGFSIAVALILDFLPFLVSLSLGRRERDGGGPPERDRRRSDSAVSIRTSRAASGEPGSFDGFHGIDRE